ncbi:hypothetical protein, partial [Ralstonia pseudosolanacearum]|uniref:hypothetical protein n=1 Tax=Ralstonia pseudosolanacearum TaxID=1310165 RepID=UPI003CEE4C90
MSFIALWHTRHAQNSSRITEHAYLTWIGVKSVHSQGVVNKAGSGTIANQHASSVGLPSDNSP